MTNRLHTRRPAVARGSDLAAVAASAASAAASAVGGRHGLASWNLCIFRIAEAENKSPTFPPSYIQRYSFS